MAYRSLTDLGISLSNEFQSLVHNYTSGWLTGCLFSREDWQEIDRIFQEAAQVERVINESEVWEKLLTTGFIPSDLANDNNVNVGEKTTSDGRERIHPYLETWKRYESWVSLDAPIPTASRQFSDTDRRSHSDSPLSPISPNQPNSLADSSSTPTVASQRLQANNGQAGNIDAPISTASRQSSDTDRRSHSDSPLSPISPNQPNSLVDTSSTPTVASQRLQANGQAGNNQPVLGKLSEDIGEVSLSNQVGRGMHITEPASLQFNSDSYTFSEVSPVDNSASQNPDDWQSQDEKIRSLNPNFGSEGEELFPNEAIYPENLTHSENLLSSIKGLKDLANFLESQPNLEHIVDEDLPTKPASNIANFLEPINPELSPFADTSSALYPTVQDIGTVAGFVEQLAQNPGLAELGKQVLATETIAALSKHNQNSEIGVELIPMSSDRNPELDMDLILGAIAQEINREYRRFYGE